MELQTFVKVTGKVYETILEMTKEEQIGFLEKNPIIKKMVINTKEMSYLTELLHLLETQLQILQEDGDITLLRNLKKRVKCFSRRLDKAVHETYEIKAQFEEKYVYSMEV